MSKSPLKSRVLGPDGIVRTADEEDRLNSLISSWASSPLGRQCVEYLRSITTDMVAGPNVSNDELRHREGQRYLLGIIEARKVAGSKLKGQRHADIPSDET